MQTSFITVFVTVIAKLAAGDEFVVYTHESIRDDNGKPCLTGCSPITHECIIEARGTYREKRSCKVLEEPAPIYLTAQKEDPGSKYCLSNCGRFNKFFNHEWCFTRKDLLTWDYCSSNTQKSLLPNGHQRSMTTTKKTCSDECSKSKEKTYFWCYYSGQAWDICALTAIPRIPVLDGNFRVGQTTKGNCDNFLRYDSEYEKIYASSSDVPDNSIIDIAEAIEGVGNNKLTQVSTLYELANPVKSYAMVKIRDMMVPAVLRAHITGTNFLVGNQSNTEIPSSIVGKLRQQMSYGRGSYESSNIISFDLGGPNAEYNLVPIPPNWKCGEWGDMEEAIKSWCQKTGGSVDLLIVVFYEDAKTPIPKAFGVSQVFRNADQSVFVDCREKIYFNN